jgi:hypothetical protein
MPELLSGVQVAVFRGHERFHGIQEVVGSIPISSTAT